MEKINVLLADIYKTINYCISVLLNKLKDGRTDRYADFDRENIDNKEAKQLQKEAKKYIKNTNQKSIDDIDFIYEGYYLPVLIKN
jgi:hypothetical protein